MSITGKACGHESQRLAQARQLRARASTWKSLLFAALGLPFALAGSAFADEAAQKLIDGALPLMHHSCESVVEETGGNHERIDEVVRALTAVSVYNRGIVITDYAKTDAEKDVLREKFIVAVKKGCKSDPQALLAGVIDDAVVFALSSN